MISVVIPARDAASFLGPCLEALLEQAPAPDEIVVVDDGSTDATGEVARARGARLIRLECPAGPAGARNAGARLARGDVLAFVDADDRVEPGWCEAIRAGFAAGADAAAAGIVRSDEGSMPQRLAARNRPIRQAGAGGGLIASGGQLVLRRETFEAVGRFDEDLRCCEDIDISLRLSLGGHPITPLPEARVVRRERPSIAALLRQRWEWGRWWPILEWKYQDHHFALAPSRVRPRMTWMLATAVASAGSGDRAGGALGALRALSEMAQRAGAIAGKLDLNLGRRRVSSPVRVPWGDPPLRPALPAGPDAVLIGASTPVATLSFALRAGSTLAAPPPGLVGAEPWNGPAPWARRLVADARGRGWRLPVDIAARALELERPATYGDAVIGIHGVFAWLHRKSGFVISAPDPEGSAAAAAIPEARTVAIGGPGDLVIEPDALAGDPAGTVRRLGEVVDLGTPDRVIAALRLARFADWRPW